MNIYRKAAYTLFKMLKFIIVPNLNNSQFKYRDILKSRVMEDTIWLDIGCGHQILPAWMPSSSEDQSHLVKRSKLVVGVDRDRDGLKNHLFIRHKIFADLQALPFSNDSLDLVTANMVVEHILRPEVLLSEVHRVLMPGGSFIFHTPNRLNYQIRLSTMIPNALKKLIVRAIQGRKEEDIFPTHYRMNAPDVIRDMLQESRFQLIELILTNSTAMTVMLGPLVLFELLLIRILEFDFLKSYRSNIIAIARKPLAEE